MSMNDPIKFVSGPLGSAGSTVIVQGSLGGSAQGTHLGEGNVHVPGLGVLRADG